MAITARRVRRVIDLLRPLGRPAAPAVLLGVALQPGAPRRRRGAAVLGLVALWSGVYVRYRRAGLDQTRREYELMKTVDDRAFALHYNERVPTIDEEFALWGPYHQHRHEMRYDLVAAAARRHLRTGGVVLDIGCGAALVADRLADTDACYVGFDFGAHHIDYARRRLAIGSEATAEGSLPASAEGSPLAPPPRRSGLSVSFVRGDGERLPLADASVDLVVFSEVIEHLVRPELAVWELARVLRPGGALVMTTNNASEMPLRSPLSHPLAWLEKMLGAEHPGLISLRPWVWPDPVDRQLLGLSPEAPDVYVPHSHHIQGETRRLLAAAGLETVHWSTFEFPPPQSRTGLWLEARGPAGRRFVDAIEAVATRTPGLRRLGSHLLMVAVKSGPPVAGAPPPGLWPGPFST